MMIYQENFYTKKKRSIEVIGIQNMNNEYIRGFHIICPPPFNMSPPSFWQKSEKGVHGCTGKKSSICPPPSFLKKWPKGGDILSELV